MKRTMWIGAMLWAAALSSMGCTPSAIGYILSNFEDPKIPAACKLADEDKDKEVTVAIVCRFAESPSSPELWTADMEIADLLYGHLTKACKANKEKVKFVSNARVKSYLTRPISDTESLQDIGKKLKADKVIDLEINSLSLLIPNSGGTLYQGKANIDVRVVEVDAKADPVIFSKVFTLSFPKDRPEDASDMTPRQFRPKLSNRIAEQLSHYFTAWEPKRHEMD